MSPALSYLFLSYSKKMPLWKQDTLFAVTGCDRYDLENSHLQVFAAIYLQLDMQSTVESSGSIVYTKADCGENCHQTVRSTSMHRICTQLGRHE